MRELRGETNTLPRKVAEYDPATGGFIGEKPRDLEGNIIPDDCNGTLLIEEIHES
jgi:hypothetical protein